MIKTTYIDDYSQKICKKLGKIKDFDNSDKFAKKLMA